MLRGKLTLVMSKTTESKFVNELVKDCITYGLEEQEALKYIEIRFKSISLSSYKHRKARVLSEDASQIWLNHFTRIGFVQHHKEQIEVIQKIQDDSLRQFFIETNRTTRDEFKISRLKNDMRERQATIRARIGYSDYISNQSKTGREC